MTASLARTLPPIAAAMLLAISADTAWATQDAGGRAPLRETHEHGSGQQAPAAPTHEQHDHGGHDETTPSRPPFIPPITDEDRKAAFPDVKDHAVHDDSIHYLVLFDRLEWQSGGDGRFGIDSEGWAGFDRDRLWFRLEGEADEGRAGETQLQALYGRQIARWWDLVAGVRQDFGPGPNRTWAAVGIQGLAPYWFDVEATAFIGDSGRTAVRVETEYELLLTNRLVLQPLLGLEINGTPDRERGIGAGLSTSEAGLRLRYEIRREFAPYIGVAWFNRHGKTADLARESGEDAGGARFVAGVRAWF